MYDLIQLLFSERPLWMTPEGYRQLMMLALSMQNTHLPADKVDIPAVKEFFFFDPPTYKEEAHKALAKLKVKLAQEETTKSIKLTDEFDSPELPQNSIAYHRIFGTIFADSRWWASTKQLEHDVLMAEQNPAISCHFMHINSPGGEAWYLDRLSETLQNSQKPIIVLCEEMCASAAYLIACHGNKVLASTQYDFIGSIGTMTSFHDFEPYYEKLGIKKVEAYATNSDLKNKLVRDLREGKPQQFIERVLDPLNEMFMATVRSQRTQLAQAEDSAPVMRGEIFYTQDAASEGLIDGTSTFVDAVADAYQMGCNYSEAQRLKTQLYNI